MTLKTGFIGFSDHAFQHIIPCIVANAGYKLLYAASRSDLKRDLLKSKFPELEIFHDWKKVIDPNFVDVVFVTGPPKFHEEVVCYAAKVGIPIFVEKPCASSTVNLENLISEINNHRHMPTFVGYNFRYSSMYLHLKKEARSRGNLRYTHITFLTNKPKNSFWHYQSILESYIYAIAVHPINMAATLLDMPIVVSAHLQRINTNHFSLNVVLADSEATVELKMGNFSTQFDFKLEMLTDQNFLYRASICSPTKIYVESKHDNKIWYRKVPFSSIDRDGLGYGSIIEQFRKEIVNEAQSSSSIGESLLTYNLIDQILEKVASKNEF